MDVRCRPDRRTNRQTATHSIHPKSEELRHEKVAVHNRHAPNLAKNPCSPLLPIAGKKDLKYPSLNSVNYNRSGALNINELLSNERTHSKVKAWTQSSPNTQKMDICHQKRPLKLAPLHLPEEVKEAQLQKMNAMKNEVFLGKKNPIQAGKTTKTFSNQPMLRDPLNKVGLFEENLPKFKATNIVLKDNGDASAFTALIGNKREKKSSNIIDQIKNGQIQDEAPKDITVISTDGQKVPSKGRFINTKSPNPHLGTARPAIVDRLVIEHSDRTGGTGYKGDKKKKKNQVELMTPTLNI